MKFSLVVDRCVRHKPMPEVIHHGFLLIIARIAIYKVQENKIKNSEV